ncbi:MAG: N-6 DNA Methylase [Candidatus Latescibacteria bacterium ADurb.Bin168]|nr:MAG: N-6 DNA Methylase [Candidatus Latescibacteria bacterium ADurb.Bin168]
MHSNLEALIDEHAARMAERMVAAAKDAHSEEDVRHEVNSLIDGFVKEAGLTIKGRHEYGLAGGRVDSKYGHVVIEFKDPHGSGKITENRDAPGTKAVVEQILTRFHGLQVEEHVEKERVFGVGCDGDTFVFVTMPGRDAVIVEPQPVTPYTVTRLLRALVSLGARGLSFTPQNLAERFGSDGESARNGIRLIHDLIHETQNPKAQTFFRQWQILFGEVCGYDIYGRNAKIARLAEHYGVRDADPAELLFAVHTYYALFIKLLAEEIVASFSPLGTSTLEQIAGAPTPSALRERLRTLEQGGIWSQLGIHNFLEGDLFSWYLDAWDERSEQAVRGMTTALREFDATTLSVEPSESRDLLKQLYQQLFPKSVRHDLGEYYTPDWLADLVLDELGYDGNPDKRLLDPACGSGTFLVMALNRVKAWYAQHRYECGYDEKELLRKVLNNIIGFDLNPLAVMAARTNYLMAIRDLLRHADNVELPVYLCDSIMTPKDFSTAAAAFDYIPVSTAVGQFNIPNEVLKERGTFDTYARTLHQCIENGYTFGEFAQRCAADGVPTTQHEHHRKLYDSLLEVKRQDRNGIWARIIKNAFAPLFVGTVDFVAGNPPWVNWENLPEDYRNKMKPLWKAYGLFSLSGSAGRHGGGKKDLSMLFVYCGVDRFLRNGGKLGFVITQSVFKTQGAGDGFRRLRFARDARTTYLKPLAVADLSAIQVFEGATNRTAVFVCEKQRESFQYPVKYAIWRGPSRISQDVSLTEARSLVNVLQVAALPVDPEQPNSPWLTAPRHALRGILKVIGKSDYEAYAGCCTWLNSVFWVRILERRPNGDLLIENLHDVGKIKVEHVQTVIESGLVYPLLRGRDVKRWHAEPSAHIILAQDPVTRTGIRETVMKVKYPKTYDYLKGFEGDPKKPVRGTLRGRSGYRQYFKPTDPFYTMYNVGEYTLAEWKVVWREQSSFFQAGLSEPSNGRVQLPDHKLMLVPFRARNEGHYLASMLNSHPSLLAVTSYVLSTSTSTHVLENVRVPRFDEKNADHAKVAELSCLCHAAAARGDADAVEALEAEIDTAAAKIWGITDDELRAIQDALTEMGLNRADAEPEDTEED